MSVGNERRFVKAEGMPFAATARSAISGVGGFFQDVARLAGVFFSGGGLSSDEYLQFRQSLVKGCLYAFAFIYALATLIRIVLTTHKVPIKYTWTELLINYQSGFVRRGLVGEILFQLQPTVSPVVTAAVLVFCGYFLFTWLALKFVKDTPLVVFLFFVFSPAGFLFSAYDPAVFGRKEVFALAAFALAIAAYRRFADYRTKLFAFLALYTTAALIHETAVFFAPLAACLLVFSMKDRSRSFRAGLLCSLLFYVAALMGFLWFINDPNHDTTGIVKSWEHDFPNLSTGSALNYLHKSTTEVMAETAKSASDYYAFTRPYIVDFYLALLPAAFLWIHTTHLRFCRTLGRKEPLLLVLTAASLLAPLPLFCFEDWGRWIYLISTHTLIFLVTLVNLGLVEYKTLPPLSKYQRQVYFLLFLFYTILWRMPHQR